MEPQTQNSDFQTMMDQTLHVDPQASEQRPRRKVPWKLGLIIILIIAVLCAGAYAMLKHNADTAVTTYKTQLIAFNKQAETDSKKALVDADSPRLVKEVQDAKNNGIPHDEILALARKNAATAYQADYDAQSASFTKLPKLRSVFLGSMTSKGYRDSVKRQQDIHVLYVNYLKLERYSIYGLRFADLATILQDEFVEEIDIAQQISKIGGVIQDIVDPTASSKSSATRESLISSYDLDLSEHAKFKESIQNFPLLKEYESIRTKALASEEKMVAAQKRLVAAYKKGDATAYQKELKVYNKDTKYAYVTTFVDDVSTMAGEVAKVGNSQKPVDLIPQLTRLLEYK